MMLAGVLLACSAPAAHLLTIDCARTNGIIRPLHGINKGPLSAGGIVDLSARHAELAPPLNRLHDCHWPNPDVVDIHAVFPNSAADPAVPASYTFAATDEYLAAVRKTGAQIVYRLGESIEHTSIKRFVNPPVDVRRWAQICTGVVRHYNEGWAAGPKLGIRYWEIWNEPENRPLMWTGNDAQFLDLYATTAKALKDHDNSLKVGGPSFGYTGQFVAGKFQPSPFVTNFLGMCRNNSVPLDFFSWHCYTSDPAELVSRARAIRSLLDSFGFTNTESHLNEWNYLTSWTPLSRKASADARQQAYNEISGPAGAAFIAAALIELQDAPVDVCNLYHADVGAFGLFTEQGVPTKNFFAVRAFRDLAETQRRCEARDGIPGKLAVAAGVASPGTVRILVSNCGLSDEEFTLVVKNLPWGSHHHTRVTARIVDRHRRFEQFEPSFNGPEIPIHLPNPGLALVVLTLAD